VRSQQCSPTDTGIRARAGQANIGSGTDTRQDKAPSHLAYRLEQQVTCRCQATPDRDYSRIEGVDGICHPNSKALSDNPEGLGGLGIAVTCQAHCIGPGDSVLCAQLA
jgi:hypothetical protein